jgi:hypothetical protein
MLVPIRYVPDLVKLVPIFRGSGSSIIGTIVVDRVKSDWHQYAVVDVYARIMVMSVCS